MRKFAKPILFVGGGIVALLAIVLLCVNVYLQSTDVQNRIRSAATAALGSPVTIRSAYYTPWSGLVLRGISIPGPQKDSKPMLEAEGLSVSISLPSLLSSRYVISDITFDNPILLLKQNDDGRWQLRPESPRKLPPVPVMQPPPAPPEPPEPKTETPPSHAKPSPSQVVIKQPGNFEIKRCRVRKASAIFLDAKGRVIARLTNLEIISRLTPEGSMEGTVQIGEAECFERLFPKNIRSSFTWKGGLLSLPDMKADLAKGKVTGKGTLAVPGTPLFTLSIKLDTVLLDKLVEEAGLPGGKASGHLNGDFILQGDTSRSATMAGNGQFQLQDAVLEPIEFIRSLGDILQVDELKLLKLKTALLQLTIKDEKVMVEDLTLESENLFITGKGPIRFNSKLNLDGRLLVNQKLQKQLKGLIGKNFTDSTTMPGYKEIAFKVTGKLDRPKSDLLDQLTGINLGQDMGGILKNLFQTAQPKKEDNKTKSPAPSPAAP